MGVRVSIVGSALEQESPKILRRICVPHPLGICFSTGARLQSTTAWRPTSARADDQARNSADMVEARFRLPGAGFSNKVGFMTYSDILTIEPGKRGGKPCIRGLRITVYDVLEYLASGMAHAEVLQEFPYLTEEDILACLAYAADRERKLEISNA